MDNTDKVKKLEGQIDLLTSWNKWDGCCLAHIRKLQAEVIQLDPKRKIYERYE